MCVMIKWCRSVSEVRELRNLSSLAVGVIPHSNRNKPHTIHIIEGRTRIRTRGSREQLVMLYDTILYTCILME